MTAYVGIDGKARGIKSAYIGVDGVARKVKKAYVGVDGVAQLWWEAESFPDGVAVLEVWKETSATYAGETTYEDERFILLDIYPKTNGTVNVTYGGLKKTVTDTSGAEEPNAQQVFFGTFNGASDSVETPSSGTLTIEGDFAAFGCGGYKTAKITVGDPRWLGVSKIVRFGEVDAIPDNAFGSISVTGPSGASELTNVRVPDTVRRIGDFAFAGCHWLESISIPDNVVEMGMNPFANRSNVIATKETTLWNVANISLESNRHFVKDGNCLVEVSTNRVICGTHDFVIPPSTRIIGDYAFYCRTERTDDVEIPANVVSIGSSAFSGFSPECNLIVRATTPPSTNATAFSFDENSTGAILVPVGCAEAYKAAEGWSEYADYIMEMG